VEDPADQHPVGLFCVKDHMTRVLDPAEYAAFVVPLPTDTRRTGDQLAASLKFVKIPLGPNMSPVRDRVSAYVEKIGLCTLLYLTSFTP
jgi:hypothetical protein